MNLVSLALRRPVSILVLVVATVLGGWLAVSRMQRDIFPDLGVPTAMTRGDLTWRITIPADGHRPGRGLVPTLIQWSGVQHPTDRMPDSGCRLVAVAGEHPEPALVRGDLAALGLSETMKVTYGKLPRIAAMIRTSRGIATL